MAMKLAASSRRSGGAAGVIFPDAADTVDNLTTPFQNGLHLNNTDDADFEAFTQSAELDPADQILRQTLSSSSSSLSRTTTSVPGATAAAAAAAAAPRPSSSSALLRDPPSPHKQKCVLITSSTTNGVDDVIQQQQQWSSHFVTPHDFELRKVIGMGAFGKVLQVRHKHSQQVLAMKVMSKRLLRRKSSSGSYIENIHAERNILTKVRHPFIVTMHCSFQTKEKLFIVMEYCAAGEMFNRLGREGIFLEHTACFYLAEIILALDHLHNLGILHRDLKPENVLLDSCGHVKLTDFGLAKDSGTGLDNEDGEPRALTICGTHEYMAPEMLARQGYGKAADYWSLGCIAYEMLAGMPPFQRKRNESYKDLFSKIMSERVKMPAGSTAEACKLLKGLLNRDVQKRLGAAKSTMFDVGGVSGLKSQPFFVKTQWDKLENKLIDPPATFAVHHDEDVQHFHEEFTGMPLPRSVVEMSQGSVRPHRVESEHFRGFSFIHDDFVMPERQSKEIEAYWRTIEEDGESASDCASSRMGDIESTLPVIDKNKRPPRKRKKKGKGGESSAATTPMHSAPTTPAHSTATTPVTSAAPTPEPSENGDGDVPETAAPPATSGAPIAANNVALSPPALSATPAPVNVKQPAETWRAVGSANGPKQKARNSNPGTHPVNNGNASHVPVSRGNGTSATLSRAPPLTHQRMVLSGQKAPHHQVKATIGAPRWKAGTTTPQPRPGVPSHGSAPGASSSDWRQHRMSPSPRTAGRPVRHVPDNAAFPLLGGPPLNGGSSESAPKPVPPKLHGAWAAKAKNKP